ncbi:hypothetical protein MD484_g3445, partial [Candolleomyces efflorescens]
MSTSMTRSTTASYGYNHGASPPPLETILPTYSPSSPQPVASTSTSTDTSESVSAPPTAASAGGGTSNSNTSADPVSGASTTRRSSLPAGAMIGIVLAGIFLVVGIAIFVIRKRYVQRRQKLRKGWARSKASRLSGSDELKSASNSTTSLTADQDQTNTANTMLVAANNTTQTRRTGPRPLSLVEAASAPQMSFVLPPPPVTYGNETFGSVSQTSVNSTGGVPKSKRASSKNSSSPIYGPPSSANTNATATVVSTFITTLPDELTITTGETLRVLAEYDDGWALCLNLRGEQGMVPRECLDGRFSIAMEEMTISRGLGGKLRRISSLAPTVAANFRRF